MAGPWEDYQTSAADTAVAVAEPPPWEDFQNERKPWEEFASVPPQVQDIMDQSAGQQAIERGAGATSLGDAAVKLDEGLGAFRDQLKEVSNYVVPGFWEQATTSPLHAEPLKPSPEDSKLAAAGKAIRNTMNEFVEGATSPALLATALGGELIGGAKLVKGGFAALMASQFPAMWERVVEAEKTPPGSQERWEASLGMASTLAMVHGLGRGALKPKAAPRPAQPAPPEIVGGETRLPVESAEIPEPVSTPQSRGVTLKSFNDLPADLPTVDPRAVAAANAEGVRAIEATRPMEERAPARPTEEPPAAAPPLAVPEHLRPDPELSRLISNATEQTGPQMKFEPAVEGGAFGFGGGKRARVSPLGTTPRGDTEFLRIPRVWQRALHGLEREGATDAIGRSRNKVARLLSDATRKHVDTEQELFGQLYTTFARATQGAGRGEVRAAFDALTPYIAAKENKHPLPPLSPLSRKILTAWEDTAEFTGKLAGAHDVQVFDPSLGTHRSMRQIGRGYIPRILREEVQQALRDPNQNAPLFNGLVNEFAASKGIPVVDAANLLRAEAGRFQATDFMGNLEMARQSQLPETFYEYDLRKIAANYIPSFSERMAQIVAYGQRLGPRDAPTRPNLWDIARKEGADTYTQEWLRTAEDQQANLRGTNSFDRNAARAQTLASGLLLSSPTTSVMRNTLSGLWSSVEVLGARRSATTLAKTALSAQSRMNAREIGATRDNIGDFLHADKLGESFVDDAVRNVTDKLLKFSGYNGSEVFVRSHAALTASQFAREGVAAIRVDPRSWRAKEALGLFKRTKVDAEKIVAENADWKSGPETRKFIRGVIRDSQGGYRFDQVPLWANSNTGRFFYQFGRWGTQRARNIWRNGIQPALGERVTWQGKEMLRWDPLPLMKMALGTVALGETFGAVASALFDRDRRDASLSEIIQAWKEDERKAIGLAFERAINDIIMAGTFGIWSQPIDFVKGLKNQSRLRNPTEPPSLASVKALTELGLRALDQNGQLTKRDLIDFARDVVPGPTQLSDVARNVIDDPLYHAENDMRTLRAAGQRWAKQIGLDVRTPLRGGGFRKSEKAPVLEPIKEALLTGDVTQAQALTRAYLQNEKNPAEAYKNLRASVKQSQPFRVGPYTSLPHLLGFVDWAKRNLSAEDYNQVVRVERKYMVTAIKAGLW